MRTLKTIWLDRRLPAWGPLAALSVLGLLAVAMLLLASRLPEHLRLGSALVLGLGIVFAALRALRELAAVSDGLLAATRALADGRASVRAPEELSGSAGELAREINRLGQQLTELRTRFDERVTQATVRLRQERDQHSEQLQQLRASAGQVQNEARAQSELVSSLSHELRTPLTAILGYSDLLRRSGLNPDQAQQLETLDKSARALLAMINDLLDWSRIEAGRLRLNEDAFDIHDVIEDTIALLAPLAYGKDLELVRIVYHDVPQQLRGDAQRLRQILTNLLSNAIKFTDSGEIVLRVMQEREAGDRSGLRFAVTDTGIGISPEQQAKLFQPYRQVGFGQGGSGLGLSITRKLCELMGGEVNLHSALGQGSTFSVLLPFKLAADATSTRAHDPRLAERSLWLHEPHASSRLALTHWLEFWGVRVRAFGTADELVAALRHAGSGALPDWVLLGLKPRAVTDPAIRNLLAACRDRQPPLLALVASAALPVQEALRAAGATACHAKSVNRTRLHDELLRLLTQTATQSSPQRPMQGRRAVVADNNAVNRRWLAMLSSELGLEVTQTANGREAYEAWKRERPDIVLLDARMPEMDGPSCARAIRAAERDGSAPCRIVAVSAHLEPEERRAFLDAGADEVLIKPFDENQLLRALVPVPVAATRNAAKLAADPELLALLREELPQQFGQLQQAMQAQDLIAARDAAHTLRGTAAFYHLASLRQTTAALESWLQRATAIQVGPTARRELENVRRAVDDTLSAIHKT